MNGFYGDHVLARMIANERISHRESISLSLGWNPIRNFTVAVRRFVNELMEQTEQPKPIPVYCTEFSPSC